MVQRCNNNIKRTRFLDCVRNRTWLIRSLYVLHITFFYAAFKNILKQLHFSGMFRGPGWPIVCRHYWEVGSFNGGVRWGEQKGSGGVTVWRQRPVLNCQIRGRPSDLSAPPPPFHSLNKTVTKKKIQWLKSVFLIRGRHRDLRSLDGPLQFSQYKSNNCLFYRAVHFHLNSAKKKIIITGTYVTNIDKEETVYLWNICLINN